MEDETDRSAINTVKINPPGIIELLTFFGKASLWAAVTYYLGLVFANYHLGIVILSVYVFSIPIVFAGLYLGTITQIRRLHIFAGTGIIYRFTSHRILRTVFWIVWALSGSLFMVVQFHTYTNTEWIAFFLIIPVFFMVFRFFRSVARKELKPYLQIGMPLRWALRITPILMLPINFLIIKLFGNIIRYASFHEALISQKKLVEDMVGSNLVLELSQWLAMYSAAKVFAMSTLADYDAFWAMFISVLGNWFVFFNASAILSSFLIPWRELTRIFGPLVEDADPPMLSASRIVLISAVFTFLSFFIYVPIFAALEAHVSQSDFVRKHRERAEILLTGAAEKIGETYVKTGTIRKIQELRLEVLNKLDLSHLDLMTEVDRSFDKLGSNVDLFLDWYYSLPAEYARIVNLIGGNLEQYLTEQLSEKLKTGNAFGELESKLNNVLSQNRAALEEYERKVKQIIANSKVDFHTVNVKITETLSLADALAPPVHMDRIDFKKRLMGSTGTGALAGTITAYVAGKVVSQAIGKATISKAAQVIVKVLGGKVIGSAGGAGAGAAMGSAVGSVVPGVGTVVGGIVGGVIGGLVIGISVDKAILLLEEYLSREQFKRELVDAIEIARKEFKGRLQELIPGKEKG